MAQITLDQMLAARERRKYHQCQLLSRYRLPLISFTLNIPGPTKRGAHIERAYRVGLALLRARFAPLYTAEALLDTGCEALLVVKGDPAAIKRQAVAVEDADALGRLFDIDVLDGAGNHLSRADLGLQERTCLLCDQPAHLCARSRAHDVAALYGRAMDIIQTSLARAYADQVAAQAQRALLYEVAASPKPGLVDRLDSGAHDDMDIFTFIDSAAALAPYLRTCALKGMEYAHRPPAAMMDALAEHGLRAEQQMYRATGQVNTHKGAIYTMGLACAAAGALYAQDMPFAPRAALRLCGQIARDSAQRFFDELTPHAAATAGEKLYLRHGLRGARGEAADGFPTVLHVGLPALTMALGRGLPINDAACVALLHLIAAAPDTALIARSSYAAWQRLSAALKEALAADPLPSPAHIQALNRAFIQENLSPGGSADLLALTLFTHFLVTQS